MEAIYYFGCESKSRCGHYLWSPGLRSVRRSEAPEIPWARACRPKGSTQKHLDTELCPQARGERHRDGCYLITHTEGWTAWAFWDRTADSRPNSHSTFISPGTLNVEEMEMLAKQFFPRVMARVSRLKLYASKEST